MKDLWQNHISYSPQPDKRHTRYPLTVVDTVKLQLDAQPGTDYMIRDRKTGDLVMIVLRDFTGHSALHAYIKDICQANIEYRKSMRVCCIFNSFRL